MGLYIPGYMMNDLVYGQISYISCLSNSSKLKLGHNLALFLIEIKVATGKDIAEHVIRLAKEIPTILIMVRYAQQLISKHRPWWNQMKMTEWKMRR